METNVNKWCVYDFNQPNDLFVLPVLLGFAVFFCSVGKCNTSRCNRILKPRTLYCDETVGICERVCRVRLIGLLLFDLLHTYQVDIHDYTNFRITSAMFEQTIGNRFSFFKSNSLDIRHKTSEHKKFFFVVVNNRKKDQFQQYVSYLSTVRNNNKQNSIFVASICQGP